MQSAKVQIMHVEAPYSSAWDSALQHWSRFSAICLVCWQSRIISAAESTLTKRNKKKNSYLASRSVSHDSSCIGVMPAENIIYF